VARFRNRSLWLVLEMSEKKKYKVKPLNFGERNDILDQTLYLDEENKTRLARGIERFLTLRFGIVEPKLTDDQIKNLDEKLASELYRKIVRARA